MSMIIDGTTGVKFPDDSIQAESMTEYGVGGLAKLLSGASSLDDITVSGLYVTTGSLNNEPWGNSVWALVQHIAGVDSIYAFQIAYQVTFAESANVKIRQHKSGGWSSWYVVWNALSDGNGGQPPAPRPRTDNPAGVAGCFSRAEWDGAYTRTPTGGQWLVINYDHSSATWNPPFIMSGGGTIASSDLRNKYLCWRILA